MLVHFRMSENKIFVFQISMTSGTLVFFWLTDFLFLHILILGANISFIWCRMGDVGIHMVSFSPGILISLHLALLYFADTIHTPYKWKVCGKPALSRPTDAIFLTDSDDDG